MNPSFWRKLFLGSAIFLVLCATGFAQDAVAILPFGKEDAIAKSFVLTNSTLLVDGRGCVHGYKEGGGSLSFFFLTDDIGRPVCNSDGVGVRIAGLQFVTDSRGCLHGIREAAGVGVEAVRILDEGGYPLCRTVAKRNGDQKK